MDVLKTFDYDSVDIVSPLFGAITEAFCNFFETAEATKKFSEVC